MVPQTRPLKVFAFDASLGRQFGNVMTVDVDQEDLKPGPRGRLLEVIDSTQNTPWKSIPQPALMKRLQEKTGRRAVRSDSLPVADGPPGARLPALPPGFRTGPLSIDYLLRV